MIPLCSLVLGILALSVVGCGPSEPTCSECLAQQEQNLPAEDGCWPYCEPTDKDGDGCPDVELQVVPQGTYDGAITLTSVDGPDTSQCYETPIGFTIPLYIVIQDQDVHERGFRCEAPTGTPDAYSVLCVNRAIDQICDPTTDPRCDPSHPEYYSERRDFHLSFTRDASRVTGTLTDTRNWGGCSVRRWAVDFEQRPLP